jgi:hypothetical protein
MNKLSKEKQQQIVAVIMGTLMVVAALWFLVINGLRDKRAAARDAINAVQQKIDDGESKRQRAKAVQEHLATLEKKLGAVEAEMASGELYAWLDTKLNDFIGQNQFLVDIPTKSRGDIVEVQMLPDFRYKGVKYILRGSAYYHEFGKFVAAFENTFPYISIQNVELLPVSEMTVQDPARAERLEFRFELVALQKPIEEPKTEAKPAAQK